ncbi:MAG: response regulator transcription factor [Bacteroidota bacterium]
MTLKYLIIDDECLAHEIIQEYAAALPNLELVKNYYDALEALTYLNSNEVDLIFLDLNMPKIKGFEFLRTLTHPPKVIVTTAYQEHALEGYELNVVDYLLKPFSFSRFLTAVNKVTASANEQPPTANLSKGKENESIFLRSNKKHIQVNLATILYVEASGNYTKIITTEETISIRAKISDVLTNLPTNDFLQVHKSFAVATQHISSIGGNRIFIKDAVIPIGKMYKMQVNQLLR